MRKTKLMKELEESDAAIEKAVTEELAREEIKPLELHLDFGRHDLNDAVGKLQEKINEIIRRIN